MRSFNVRFIGTSREDLTNIYTYIAEDNPFYAEEVLKRIKRSIAFLKEFPLIGTKISGEIRYIVEPKYRFKIVYIFTGTTVSIVSISKYRENWSTFE